MSLPKSIISKRVTTCSCCHEEGHNIKTCSSPEVYQFQNQAKLSASSARCIADLQQMSPFNNARTVLLKAISVRLKLANSVSKLQNDCLIKNIASYYWKRYNPSGSNYAACNQYKEATITAHISGETKIQKRKKPDMELLILTEQDILRELAPQLIAKSKQIRKICKKEDQSV